MEFYRMAGDVDYMLRVVVPDIAGYDTFYKTPDCLGAAEQRHLPVRHGEDQVDDSAADSVRRRSAFNVRSREGSGGHRLSIAAGGLSHRLVKVFRKVAKCDAARTIWRAAVGLAIDRRDTPRRSDRSAR